MTTHQPNTQETGTQTFSTQEASTQTSETSLQETCTPETSTPETSTDKAPKTKLAKLFLIPFITRFLLHIPTAMVGAWSISIYGDASFWGDDFSAVPNCLRHLQATRGTGIVAFTAFAWNFFQFIPSAMVQGLAQGIIGVVDMAFVLGLFIGAMVQAAFLPQTCDGCPVSKSFGGTGRVMYTDLSDWCGNLTSTMKFTVGVACLYSVCAVANLWLGFSKARKDAKLEQSTPTDLWIANKVSIITLPVGRLIVRCVSGARGLLGKKDVNRAGAGKTFESFENESTAAAEETIGLMHQKRDDDDDTELYSLSRLSGETEDGSGFSRMTSAK